MEIQKYRVTLADRKEVAEETVAFDFEKPKDFSFTAGQYVTLGLLNPKYTGKKGNTRALSIASAPYERYVTLVMRKSISAFKRSLWEIPIGGEAEIIGPLGKFVLPDDKKQEVVFLVGGIGITPVRSMIRQAVHDNSERKMCLFYSNRRPHTAAYEEDFESPGIKEWLCVNTMTEIEGACSIWNGETGFIRPEILQKYIDDVAEPLYYVVGPGGFVKAIEEMLLGLNVQEEKIKIDNFGTY